MLTASYLRRIQYEAKLHAAELARILSGDPQRETRNGRPVISADAMMAQLGGV